MRRLASYAFLLILLAGCRTAPPRGAGQLPLPSAPRLGVPSLIRLAPDQIPAFDDDADTASLRAAALQSAAFYRTLPPAQIFRFGIDNYSAQELAASMDAFVALLDGAPRKSDWLQRLTEEFWIYQSIGTDAARTVTFSAYYEPTIAARLAPDARYRFPLYARPPDLIDADLGLFNPTYQGARISGRLDGHALKPYYTRADIDSRGILKNVRLEIAYARDPLDIFFLQVEGSGWLDTGTGAPLRIRYDGDNGRPYRSVGRYLITSGRVKAKGFSHEKLERYMAHHARERQALLDYDERYIFFRIDTSTDSAFAYGNLSEPLTAGRSIATDPKVFPKGALAWIQVQNATPARKGSGRGARGRKMLSRFVLNQDEGSAIQGPGRVDFFIGHGPEAEWFATHFWNPGKLYFLVKKPTTSADAGRGEDRKFE